MFRELCGDAALKNVVLVTNMWGGVPPDIGESRERELSRNFFKPALDLGAKMVRHHNTIQSAQDIIRKITAYRPIVLQIQRELVDEKKGITNTAAGEAVKRELNEQMKQHEDECKRLWEDMVQVTKEKDEETRMELDEERRRLQERMAEITKDEEGMALGYTEEKKRVEARVTKMEQEAKNEREQAEPRLANLDRRLQDATNTLTAGGARLEQEVEKERGRTEVEYKRQLADLERHLREMANAAAADRAKWERHHTKLEEKVEVMRQTLQQRTRELQGQIEEIKKNSEGLQARIKEVERGAKEEREQAEAKHQLQLVDLTRRLQDETDASAAHRARLEQEMKKLQDRVLPTTVTMPPCPAPCVRPFSARPFTIADVPKL